MLTCVVDYLLVKTISSKLRLLFAINKIKQVFLIY